MKYMKSKELAITLAISIALSLSVFLADAVAGGCGGCLKGIPTITLRNPKMEGIQQVSCSNIKVGIKDIKRFHGSVGPGIALGYRACQIALSHLYPGEIPPKGDQFVVSGSTKACPAEAVTYITGAWHGKGSKGILNGNLAFDESIGEFCFIFASISTGKAIKLTKKFDFPKGFKELKSKLRDKDTPPKEKKKCLKEFNSVSIDILVAPEKDVFEVTPLPGFSWKDFKKTYMK
ncbi:MAG: formylmethanofuran dehydrogenase subunit E family protein [Thermodesulfobacteriota bacterium]|nr:formylmethanofuran dehydrogenase subunit E family protein [Thermodesulfobacteriota bacterium]